MNKQLARTWRYPAVLAVSASCGLGVVAGAEPENEVHQAAAGRDRQGVAQRGCRRGLDERRAPTIGHLRVLGAVAKGEAGAIPAFRFPKNADSVLAKLPDPGTAFGLDFIAAITPA